MVTRKPVIFPETLMQEYIDAGWDLSDAIVISDNVRAESGGVWPQGKILSSVNGMPAWAGIPPPTKEELMQSAEYERQRRIDAANDFMNSKQWPGKVAIGRLKGDELVQYNFWLDYLDEVTAVDTSTAPDISWPPVPTT
ncbi:tail fiber assembly protein [Salmonella enterica subsp. enterica]|nr:tail fiber assembly protein [Salmonella enterica]EAN4870298.1 tail fiber assembly protein [Salmonella enterica subsp. enterica serovar Bergen]EAO1509211.1 tail fiber assembly protein [Salmonella enterica subsp. enterica serovar Bere]ECF6837858.1 tail fiber assembly protein [Salmonella enterica subsp. enterica]EEJ2509498.1 tail fiber assembly protein [Salmonella enterica subsp. arizonae serovar 47:z4,z23:-]EHJ5081839.1 tail fiber assembly protein [Salmonella enterica subsp. enterica serovar 